jgi:hypothetical protein
VAGGTTAELDDLVVYTELTLIAIVQGIALFLLVEAAAELIDTKEIRYAPFVGSGLLVVLVFWLLSVAHTFTIVGWPLDVGHNVLYFVVAFLQSLLYTEVGHPRSWWILFGAFAVSAWVLFFYDLRLFRQRAEVRKDAAHLEMLACARAEQIVYTSVFMPAMLAIAAAGAACAYLWPDGHYVLATIQLAGLLVFLVRVGRYLRRLAPLVARSRAARSD